MTWQSGDINHCHPVHEIAASLESAELTELLAMTGLWFELTTLLSVVRNDEATV